MGQKYAAFDSTGLLAGFYDSEDSPLPGGIEGVEITDELWHSLLAAQGTGKVLRKGGNGLPEAVDPPPPTQAHLIASYEAALQADLDAGAQAWGYDSVVSAASYAASTNAKFKEEAAALISWRDARWVQAAVDLAEITAGTKPMPVSAAAYIATLPALPARPA